jgi:hypothetical protein
MSDTAPPRRIIATEDELQELVGLALKSGTLDLRNCNIEIQFRLNKHLYFFGQGSDENEFNCNFKIVFGDVCFKDGFIAENITFNQPLERLSYTNVLEIFSRKSLIQGYISFKGSCKFNEEVNFENCAFSEEVNFLNCLFSKKATFDRSHFKNPVNIQHCTFPQGVSFLGVVLEEKLSFENNYNIKDACFQSAIFKKHVSFGGSEFTNSSSFLRSTFEESIDSEGGVDFTGCTFTDSANFEQSSFRHSFSFNSVTLDNPNGKDGLNFSNCIFWKKSEFENFDLNQGNLTFENAVFKDLITFYPKALSGNIKISKPTLDEKDSRLVFEFNKTEGNGIVEFNEIVHDYDGMKLKLRNLNKLSDTANKPSIMFNNCGFHGKNVHFNNVDMKYVWFKGGNYISGMIFQHCTWPKKKIFGFSTYHTINLDEDTPPKDKPIIFAELKQKLDAVGEKQIGNDFYFWQMYHQRGCFDLIGDLYLSISHFGLNWWRSLILYIGFVILFHKIYFGLLLSSDNAWLISLIASFPFLLGGFFSGFGLNFINETKDSLQLVIYLVVQAIIQGFLLFQIGAAIRNKVKR